MKSYYSLKIYRTCQLHSVKDKCNQLTKDTLKFKVGLCNKVVKIPCCMGIR